MYNKLSIKLLCILGSTLFLLDGCTGASVSRCSSAASSRGYFCYQGHNFGKNLNAAHKQGIRDGCRTASGHFKKNYTLSTHSDTYIKGWDAGRSTCKLIPPAEVNSSTMRTEYQQSIDEKKYYGT